MTVMLSRRGVLRCLTGIIAAPAIVKASRLMKIVAPPVVYDNLGNPFEAYTSYFEWQVNLPPVDWRYVARISNIDDGALTDLKFIPLRPLRGSALSVSPATYDPATPAADQAPDPASTR